MRFKEERIGGVYTIDSDIFKDNRGMFFRTFCKNEMKKIGYDINFVQINHSINIEKNTFRGFHYQKRQGGGDMKLIRCINGAVLDYLLDLRTYSPTFLKHISIELSSANKKMVIVPEGVAHGFLTLRNNTELLYHHTSYYNPDHEGSINYNDPSINLKLPYEVKNISKKDKNIPFIEDNFKGF